MQLLKGLIFFLSENLRGNKKSLFLDALSEQETQIFSDIVSDGFLSTRHYNAEASIKKKLIIALLGFNYPQSKYTALQRAFFASNVNSSAINILMGLQLRKPAIELARSTFFLAKKYNLTSVVHATSHHIFLHLYTYTTNKKEADLFFEESRKALSQLIIENNLARHFGILASKFHKSKVFDTDFITLSERVLNEYYSKFDDNSSWYQRSLTYLIGVFHYLSKLDFSQASVISKEAITYFDDLSFEHTFQTNLFRNYLAYSYLNLMEYSKALETLNLVATSCRFLSSQWYSSYYMMLLVQYRIEDYAQAKIMVGIAMKRKVFTQLPFIKQHRWHLANCYNQLVALLLDQKANPRIILKFISDDTIYQRDKASMNVNLIVMEIIYYFVNNKEDKLIDRMDALDRYRVRYFNNIDKRNNVFFKLLKSLTKTYFPQEKFIAYNSKNTEALNTYSLLESRNAEEAEIIPYNILWRLIQDKRARMKT